MTSATPTIVPTGAPPSDELWLLTSTGSSARRDASPRVSSASARVVVLVSVGGAAATAPGGSVVVAPSAGVVDAMAGGATSAGVGVAPRPGVGGADAAGGGGGACVVGVDVANTG